MTKTFEYDGRWIQTDSYAENLDEDAWTYVQECRHISYRDGEGLLFETRRDVRGGLLLKAWVPNINVSVIEAVAEIVEEELPEKSRWTG